MCVVSVNVVNVMVDAFVEVVSSHYFNFFFKELCLTAVCVEKLHYPGCCEENSNNQSKGEQIELKDLGRECLLSCTMNYVNQFGLDTLLK